MNDASVFLNEIRNQIDYTNKLEEAYITKHSEIEYLYARLRQLMSYVQNEDSDIPKLNKIITEIQKIISTDSNFREQQLQVLYNSKQVLEELNNDSNVDKSVINPLINQIDSMFPNDGGILVSGLKLNKSKKAKKRKKSKRSKKK